MNPLLQQTLNQYDVMSKSTTLNETYKSTIRDYIHNLATGNELTGPRAMREAVRSLTDKGITTIDHASGRKVRMDTMVRNSLMTEYSHIVQDVQSRVAEEVGMDGVEVSIHNHAAPDHEPFQGHVFTNEEFDKLQNGDIAEDIDGEKFQTDRPVGMWNCRHLYFGFLIGISEPSMSKRELEFIKGQNEAGIDFNGKHYSLYGAEQLQRRYEAEIRRQKETSNLYKQIKKDNPEFNKDYKDSVRRTLGLQMGYGKLGKALEPHAIRTKFDRSFVIRDKQGNIPMVLQGALSDRQIAERADIASRLARDKYPDETFKKLSDVRGLFTTVSLPQNLDNIYIAESRMKYSSPKDRLEKEAITLKEVMQSKLFTDIGNTLFLSPEKGLFQQPTIDGFLNGWETELRNITGHSRQITERFRDAVVRKEAKFVYLNIDNPKITVDETIKKIKIVMGNNPTLTNIRVIAYFTDTRILKFWNTDYL